MPRYPVYTTQVFNGELPSMQSPLNRASDTRYSGSTAPYYEDRLMASHGRHLAGIGSVQDEPEPGYALNELRVLAEMDDVQANGIFDAPGDQSVPNIHPDAGILAARFSLPGYLARERMFAPSEVRDVTTGRPIVPVLNSPIAYDTSAQVAFIERGMYGQPHPVVAATTVRDTPPRSITNVRMNMWPIDNKTGMGATALVNRPTGDRARRAQELLRQRIAARMGRPTVTNAEMAAFLQASAQQKRDEAATHSQKRVMMIAGGALAVGGLAWWLGRRKASKARTSAS